MKWFKHAFAIDSPDQIKLNESSELLSKINFRNSRLGSLIVTSRPSLENNESAQLTPLLRGYFDQIRNCLEVNRPQAAGLNRSMWQTYRWIDIRCRRSSEKSSKASVRRVLARWTQATYQVSERPACRKLATASSCQGPHKPLQ